MQLGKMRNCPIKIKVKEKNLCGSMIRTIDHCLDKDASRLWAEEKSDDL